MTKRAPSDAAPLRVLIAGGGIAAAEAVIALRALAGERVSITLLSPEDNLVYRPLSVVAAFGGDHARACTLAQLTGDFNARLVKGALGWVAPSAHIAYIATGEEISYDVLIVAIGARRSAAYEHALTFRGHEDTAKMHTLVTDVETGAAGRIAFVVPHGVVWTLPLYELALMTAARAAEADRHPELAIVTPEDRPLAVFGAEASAEVAALLDAAGIECVCGCTPEVPDPRTVVLPPQGPTRTFDRVVALPDLKGVEIRGLPADGDGFLRVTPFGHVIGVKDVYAAGDGIAFPIKQGGVACQQADVVAEAIAHRAGAHVTPSGYRPVLRGTLLTGSKPRWLRTDPGGRNKDARSEVADHTLWWPPGKVAGRYLAPYLGEQSPDEDSPIKGRAVISAGRDRGEVKLISLPTGHSAVAHV